MHWSRDWSWLDSLESTQWAPRDPRRDSRAERGSSVWDLWLDIVHPFWKILGQYLFKQLLLSHFLSLPLFGTPVCILLFLSLSFLYSLLCFCSFISVCFNTEISFSSFYQFANLGEYESWLYSNPMVPATWEDHMNSQMCVCMCMKKGRGKDRGRRRIELVGRKVERRDICQYWACVLTSKT